MWSSRELLIEVDTWTHFSRHFVHAADAEGLRPALLPHFYASLLAHACNFGVEQMAHLTDLAYDHLAWCTTWYLREDTLKAAIIALVNYHHHLPLSQPGAAASSPPRMASAFPSRARPGTPAACRRRSAMAWAITFYSWSSDQLSQYGTKYVPGHGPRLDLCAR